MNITSSIMAHFWNMLQACLALAKSLSGLNWFVGIVSGIISGFVVWWITDWCAKRRQRSFIRSILFAHYRRFRSDIVHVFISAEGGDVPWDEIKKLCNSDAFRERYPASSERYYKVLNGMEEKYMRAKMSKLFQDFSTTIVLYMNSCTASKPAARDRMLSVASSLAQQSFEFEHTGKIENPTDFAFGVIAQWSAADGDQENDFIQDAISAL